jgi:glycine/D-amino acid oxidase-like deaminating enzyme
MPSEPGTTVAVVGGGLFGVTTALELDAAGHDVVVYEQADDIMTAASWTNQWRLHRGYHYPRSPETARTCRDGFERFVDRFPEAVVRDADHHYCIAKERTKTTAAEFRSFCERLDLPYECDHPGVVDADRIDESFLVPEARIDPHSLKERCWDDLAASDVDVVLNHRVDDPGRLDAEYVVVAAYAGLNELLGEYDTLQSPYKFELYEKPVVDLPDGFEGTSAVVMDGPFMCVDPYGRTGEFLLGNVVHSIHERTVGERPAFDSRYDGLLDSGLVESPEVTNVDEILESGSEFFPKLAEADHLGSLYTVRTVPAGVEETDERPTVVEREGDVFKLFSGKLVSCIDAADAVTTALADE